MSYTHYSPSSQLFHGSVNHVMGTRFDVLLLGDEPQRLEALFIRINEDLRRLEQLFNRFDPQSRLSQLNRDGSDGVTVDREIWTILHDARRYFQMTEGCFDVTLGYFEQVTFIEETQQIVLPVGCYLDFGGYAKGYALRTIHRLLEEEQITQALVNFGDSSILACGTHPYGDCWSIGIKEPYTGKPLEPFSLRDCSLSVSGNSPANPQHLIKPHTKSVVTAQKMVAVMANDPLDAEVLTTALMVATPEEEATISPHFDIKEKRVYLQGKEYSP